MSIESEFDEIGKAEGQSQFLSSPGVYAIKITGLKMSEDDPKVDAAVKAGTAKAFMEFEAETKDGKKANIKFYRINPADSDDTKKFKLGAMKDFITNAGGNFALKGVEVAKSVIGKELNCLFKQEEFIGKDKNNSLKPEIKTTVKYSFSKPITEKIEGNQSYLFKYLKEKERAQFEYELSEWNKKHASSTSTPTEKGAEISLKIDDDLPF